MVIILKQSNIWFLNALLANFYGGTHHIEAFCGMKFEQRMEFMLDQLPKFQIDEIEIQKLQQFMSIALEQTWLTRNQILKNVGQCQWTDISNTVNQQ